MVSIIHSSIGTRSDVQGDVIWPPSNQSTPSESIRYDLGRLGSGLRDVPRVMGEPSERL